MLSGSAGVSVGVGIGVGVDVCVGVVLGGAVPTYSVSWASPVQPASTSTAAALSMVVARILFITPRYVGPARRPETVDIRGLAC
jgi:hypothetical protein